MESTLSKQQIKDLTGRLQARLEVLKREVHDGLMRADEEQYSELLPRAPGVENWPSQRVMAELIEDTLSPRFLPEKPFINKYRHGISIKLIGAPDSQLLHRDSTAARTQKPILAQATRSAPDAAQRLCNLLLDLPRLTNLGPLCDALAPAEAIRRAG